MASSARARRWAGESPLSWMRSDSSTCLPMRMVGFRLVMGSWKMMDISRPW